MVLLVHMPQGAAKLQAVKVLVFQTRLKMLFSLKMTSSTDMTDKSCKVDNPDMTLTLIDYDLTLT